MALRRTVSEAKSPYWPTKSDTHDTYWHLPVYPESLTASEKRNDLRGRGYRLDTRYVKSMRYLNHLLEVSDRGFLHYEKCTAAELLGFLNARGLDHTFPRRSAAHMKARYIRTLRHDDHHPRFQKYMELSEDVRLLVHEMYCSTWKDKVLRAPTQPPLACVNKCLRLEVLSVFYSKSLFGIDLSCNVHAVDSAFRLRIQPYTLLHLTRLKPEHLLNIRRWQIELTDRSCDEVMQLFLEITRKGSRTSLQASFKLCSSAGPSDVFIRRYRRACRKISDDSTALGRALVDELRTFGDQIATKEGQNGRFSLDDVYRMRNVLEVEFDRHENAAKSH